MNRGGLYRFGISFNKLYDYLAAARPIVFGTDAVNNLVDAAGAGLSVPANAAAALAGALECLAGMPEAERRAMGERGRRYVEANHDTRRLSQRLADVLEKVTTHAG